MQVHNAILAVVHIGDELQGYLILQDLVIKGEGSSDLLAFQPQIGMLYYLRN